LWTGRRLQRVRPKFRNGLPVARQTTAYGATSPFARAPAKDRNPPFSATQPSRREWLLLPLNRPYRHRREPRELGCHRGANHVCCDR
jgi:hypothetical protein